MIYDATLARMLHDAESPGNDAWSHGTPYANEAQRIADDAVTLAAECAELHDELDAIAAMCREALGDDDPDLPRTPAGLARAVCDALTAADGAIMLANAGSDDGCDGPSLAEYTAYNDAVVASVALVREAVAHQRVHLDAIRNPDTRPDRLPDDPWADWYARAGAAVDMLEGGA